ncbi:MAG: hypothetical protein MRY32_08935 [Rickettsiales bacterium]|nr:hypothetical protein [Rickettsiales bacterium]
MAKISFGLLANLAVSYFPSDQFASGKPIFVCSSVGFKYVQGSGEDESQTSNTPCPLCNVRDHDQGDVFVLPIDIRTITLSYARDILELEDEQSEKLTPTHFYWSHAPPVFPVS